MEGSTGVNSSLLVAGGWVGAAERRPQEADKRFILSAYRGTSLKRNCPPILHGVVRCLKHRTGHEPHDLQIVGGLPANRRTVCLPSHQQPEVNLLPRFSPPLVFLER